MFDETDQNRLHALASGRSVEDEEDVLVMVSVNGVVLITIAGCDFDLQ